MTRLLCIYLVWRRTESKNKSIKPFSNYGPSLFDGVNLVENFVVFSSRSMSEHDYYDFYATKNNRPGAYLMKANWLSDVDWCVLFMSIVYAVCPTIRAFWKWKFGPILPIYLIKLGLIYGKVTVNVSSLSEMACEKMTILWKCMTIERCLFLCSVIWLK